MNIPQTLTRTLNEWCQFYYGKQLAALALFDPALVNADYPRAEINVLLVFHAAPAQARARYDLASQSLIKSVVPDQTIQCRIQTVEEINLLAEMGLPLLEIYLREADILYDPQGVLHTARAALHL